MLVEINLLPQKDPKKIAFFIILGGLLAISLFAGVYYYFQIGSTKTSLANVERQISMTQKIREKEEAKGQTVESSSSVNQLKTAIDWADTYPIQTIPVMQHLTSLLPERGFIQSFGYTEAGTVSLTVQFDNPREAAYFLDSLHESKWIEDATLSALTAVVQEDSNAAAQEGQTAQTAGAATETTAQTAGQNPPEAAGSTGVQPNAANSAATTPTDQTTNPTVAAGSFQNSNPTATADTEVNPVLPRYTGIFEIKLNKVVVKENTNKGKKDEKGVSGS